MFSFYLDSRYYELKINFNWKDYDGRTALHFAIVGGHLNVVKFLVEKCKVGEGTLYSG